MLTRTWCLETTDRGRYCRLPALTRLGLTHGFSCRDLGSGEAEGFLAGSLGLQELPRARLRQQHTSTVHDVSAALAQTAPVGDALVARGAGWALRLQTADCLPLLLMDTRSGHYGAVHAGWRGTLAGVLRHALQALQSGGSEPGSTWMAIGPGIRACCFEIGAEVAAAFHARWGESTHPWLHPGRGSRQHLDLAAANLFQAVQAGVPAAQVLDTGLCTRCRRDLFFSYRGDGGATGRIITLAGRP